MLFFKRKKIKYNFYTIQRKCAHMGVTITEAEFQNNPQKYQDISLSYDNKLSEFLKQNKEEFNRTHQSFLKNSIFSPDLLYSKTILTFEYKFQQELAKKYKPQNKSNSSARPVTITTPTQAKQNTTAPTIVVPRISSQSSAQNASPKLNIKNTTSSTHNRRNEIISPSPKKRRNILKPTLISLPLIGTIATCYAGYNHMQTSEQEKDKNNQITLTTTPKNPIVSTDIKDAVPFSKDSITIINNEYQKKPQTTPKSKQIKQNIPIIKQDVLAQSPNIDLFNYCFNKTNSVCTASNNYGITRQIYNNFINNNYALSRFHKINNYNNITYDIARIIAKAQIYDKYGIAHIQNKSIATYIYSILQYSHQQNTNGAKIIAKSIQDFYAHYNKNMPSKQKNSLNKIIDNNNFSTNDWYNLIASINATSVNPEYESKLFALIQNRITESNFTKNNSYLSDNSNYTYEPTITNISMPLSSDINSFAPTLADLNYDKSKYEKILAKEKDTELEAFFNIYMQCSYDNYINLKYGNNRYTYFNRANNALKNQGIRTSLHHRYYCAGMSMASFCQAADIFEQENPKSHINQAIDKMLSSCKNVHYCASLKTDLSKTTNSVFHSYNLENDVKNYMKKNKNAILFVWAPRGGGNYHHQTLFPASIASQNDAYTYCAFNRQHWGDENTFAKYMRSRSKHGCGGYFADIEQGLNELATKSLNKNINLTYAMENNKKTSNTPNLYAMINYQRYAGN